MARTGKLGPAVQSGALPIFLNKVLLEHSHTHWLIYCLWLLSGYNRVDRDYMTCKAENAYSRLFAEKVYQLLTNFTISVL